ncbi:hypothetical protein NIBR502772_10460 [Pseudarthrobacter sp. NIBRBAC000502772]|uniref:hypothetical protein n=1 Tax=Pseudarthrobacter sp. NIBRBAC000502772 TaxID=2590775 RepID=UPI0011316CD2|nr:hypothetical protein [Pseudarthrobacter sp. NIBRBAC000502772]QDG66578.1 hypothetical protein NIBR502772_10460 [Pseudarthrobacter sp. NIBRBAC000502772]
MTTATGVKYETRSVKTVRGLEARTRAKLEKEGWEFVSQEQGTVRSELTFRRPKPETPWKLVGAGGGLLALLFVGSLIASAFGGGGSSNSSAEALPSPTPSLVVETQAQTAPTEATVPAEATTPSAEPPTPAPVVTAIEPQAKVEDTTCNIDENFGKCLYGQTAIYEDSRRSGDKVLLEITVQEPQEFEPGKDADFASTTLGGTQEKGADNLYFDVTIKNLSEGVVLGRSDVELVANSAMDGDFDVRSVQDDVVEAYWDAKLEPGQSSTLRSGWNFNDASEPTFKVRIDGLGGNSVTFSHN